jgi:hypothetical protein
VRSLKLFSRTPKGHQPKEDTMALKESDTTNFDTLIRAIRDGNYCLAETRLTETGEHRAAICALNETDDEVIVTPFAVMVWDNPFTMLVSPGEIALGDMRKEADLDRLRQEALADAFPDEVDDGPV